MLLRTLVFVAILFHFGETVEETEKDTYFGRMVGMLVPDGCHILSDTLQYRMSTIEIASGTRFLLPPAKMTGRGWLPSANNSEVPWLMIDFGSETNQRVFGVVYESIPEFGDNFARSFEINVCNDFLSNYCNRRTAVWMPLGTVFPAAVSNHERVSVMFSEWGLSTQTLQIFPSSEKEGVSPGGKFGLIVCPNRVQPKDVQETAINVTCAHSFVGTSIAGAIAGCTRGRSCLIRCPPEGCLDTNLVMFIWGSGFYSQDSSVCMAATHFGGVNFLQGIVKLYWPEISYERADFQNSSQNFVISAGYSKPDKPYCFISHDCEVDDGIYVVN